MKNVRVVFNRKGEDAAANEITLHQMVVRCRSGDTVASVTQQIARVSTMFLSAEQLAHKSFGLFADGQMLNPNSLVAELPRGTFSKTLFYRESEAIGTPVLRRRGRAKPPLLRKSSRDGDEKKEAEKKQVEKQHAEQKQQQQQPPPEAVVDKEEFVEDEHVGLPSMDEFFSEHKTIRLKPDLATLRGGAPLLVDWERNIESMLTDLPKNSESRKTGELAPELQSIFDFLEASDEEDDRTEQTHEKTVQMPLERVQKQSRSKKRLSVMNLKFQ